MINFRRPDPLRNDPGSKEYADHYVSTHVGESHEFTYKTGYLDVLLIDALFDQYTMLDVGCGTGGYYRLLKNYRHITGLDFSPHMITAATQLKAEQHIEGVDFLCGRFDDFNPGQQRYDVVRCIVVGWYESWGMASLHKVHGLLNQHGVAVFCAILPDSPAKWLKYLLLGNRTKIISKRKVHAMLSKAGLKQLFAIELPHAVLIFAQK
jgi:SAM-dependent methyltransferase